MLDAPLPGEDTRNTEPTEAELAKDAEAFMSAMGGMKGGA